jgi:hypothetical protein
LGHGHRSRRRTRTAQERGAPQERAVADSGNGRGRDSLRATTKLISKRTQPRRTSQKKKRREKTYLETPQTLTQILAKLNVNILPIIPCVLSFSLSVAWRCTCTSAWEGLWARRDLAEVEESVCNMRFLRDFSRRARFFWGRTQCKEGENNWWSDRPLLVNELL